MTTVSELAVLAQETTEAIALSTKTIQAIADAVEVLIERQLHQGRELDQLNAAFGVIFVMIFLVLLYETISRLWRWTLLNTHLAKHVSKLDATVAGFVAARAAEKQSSD